MDCKVVEVSPAGEDEPLRGGRQAEPSGPQQLPDSGGCHDTPETDISKACPTEAMAREKARRKTQKEIGNTHVVMKRDMKVEEHYDDCGDDLSSLKGAEMFSLA